MKNKILAATQEVTGERLIRIREVRKMTSLSASTIWRYEKEGIFPKRIRITPRCSAWKFSEVQAFIEKLAEQKGKQYGKPFKGKEKEATSYINKVIDDFCFSIDKILEMGLSPAQIEEIFKCVEKANSDKTKESVDGKAIKAEISKIIKWVK